MLESLLKNVANNQRLREIRDFAQNFACPLRRERFSSIKLTEAQRSHLYNILLLLLPYAVVSAFVYPHLSLKIFSLEIFSLLCMYGAIFLWFAEKIQENSSSRIRFMVAVTACAAPVIFVNNTIGVSLTTIFLIIIAEFVGLQYADGHRLFDDQIPAYVIGETEQDLQQIMDFGTGHKILARIIFSGDTVIQNKNISAIRSTETLRQWLTKINRLAFFPIPRRLLYLSKKNNIDVLMDLMTLSSEFSIPLFRIIPPQSEKRSAVAIAPVCLEDFESVNVTASEKATLTTALKNSSVWVYYDGRGVVLDIIYAISLASSVNLTVLCETEKLLVDAELQLKKLHPTRNYNIKIVGLEMLCAGDAKPDVLFYNMPIKLANGGENNLKEAVMKNIFETNRLIEFAHRTRLSRLMILSNLESLNASNWIGATQRIGELMAQFADSRSRKLHTKFRIIRIPNSATDQMGICGQMTSSLKSNGCINLKSPNSAITKVYYRKDILPLAIKMIGSAMKEYDFSSSVYTLIPKNNVPLENLLTIVCHLFLLRKETDIGIEYGESATMQLEDFPNITESLEKSGINGIVRTKFSGQNLASYEAPLPSIEEINNMSPRELISYVFQNLNEKIVKPSSAIKN
ncbi:MAG: polysaccharide biosynthesis protein [Holosporaceae bacterium]|nr:polysaccharide biosynthesis protein [Holosporaceae bacterium]